MLEGVCVVMIGNMSDGFSAVGPFKSWDAACEWSDKHCGGLAWVMTLGSPEAALKDLEEK